MSDSPPILKGVFAAALTPLTADLAPDHGLMAKHSRWLLDNGCDGLAVLGTTGEANSFSVAERIAIIENLVEAGVPAGVLMPGTGCCALSDTVALTRRAVELGVGGVLMLPPFYYKNVSDDGLFASYSEVIQRVGDARLRIYLYHFPKMSATPISEALIARLRKSYPDTVVGMKDSSGDLDNMINMARAFPGFAVLSGWDDLLLPLLKAGGAGCITAVANVACNVAAEIYAGWRDGSGDAAHGRLEAVRNVISQYPLSAALKEIMAHHTGNDAWRTVRPPLVGLDAAQAAALFEQLTATGYMLPKAA